MEITQQLEIFFAGLSSKLETAKEIKEQYNKTMAVEFNIFNNFFHLGENKTSEILAFFLDPNQTHGQGNVFLELFLNKFEISKELAEKVVNVFCEYFIEGNRRIDIYITFNEDEYIIAIENKIWAKDQLQQLKDYNLHLQKKIKDKYTLFYLNPYGFLPSEASITKEEMSELEKKEKIKVINYHKNIIELVDEWYKNCQAERVRFVLNDFKQYLNQEINGINIMGNNSETVANHIINSNKIEIAFEVNNALLKVKENLIRIFKEQIEEIKKDYTNIEFASAGNLVYEKDSYFSYYIKDSEKKYRISFCFCGPFSRFVYGIECRSSFPRNEFRDEITKKLGTGLGWENWVWVNDFEGEYLNWGNNAKPWSAIKDGTLKHNIKEKINKLLDVLSGLEI